MEFNETWREKVTPSGIAYSAHTASGRRTSASDSTGSLTDLASATEPTPDTGSAGGRVSANPGQSVRPSGTKCQLTLNDAAALAVPASATEPTPDASGFGLSDANWEERRAALAAKYGNNGFGLTLGMAATLAGWNTPRATDGEKGGPNQTGGSLPADAAASGWPTPRGSDIGRVRSEEAIVRAKENGGSSSLEDTVQTAGWPTPKAMDHTSNVERVEARIERDGRRTPCNLPSAAELTGWNTPTTEDATRDGSAETWMKYREEQQWSGCRLRNEVHMTVLPGSPTAPPWATPAARDSKYPPLKSFADRGGGAKGESLGNQVATSGTPATSSTAETVSGGGSRRGVLNPYFSAWLMGYPVWWVEAGLRAAATVKARSRSRSRRSKGGPRPSKG